MDTPVRTKGPGVVGVVEGVVVLPVVQVPQHVLRVLAGGGAEGTVRAPYIASTCTLHCTALHSMLGTRGANAVTFGVPFLLATGAQLS